MSHRIHQPIGCGPRTRVAAVDDGADGKSVTAAGCGGFGQSVVECVAQQGRLAGLLEQVSAPHELLFRSPVSIPWLVSPSRYRAVPRV